MSDTLLFACVDSKWEGRFNAGDKFGHVVVNVRLGNCCIGAVNVSDEVVKGDPVETFGGIFEIRLKNINNGPHILVNCDGADDDGCVPCLALGKVGSLSSFASRSSGGRIDGIFRRCHAGNCE